MDNLEKYSQLGKMYLGGLMGVSLVIIQSFISIGRLDTAGYIAVLSFAIAVPSLAGAMIIDFLKGDEEPDDKLYTKFSRLWNTGVTGAIIGTCATFWHITPIAGVTFLLTSFLVSGTVSKIVLREFRNTTINP